MKSLTEWHRTATAELDNHLLAYNHERYLNGTLNGAFAGRRMDEAYQRFDAHLSSAPVSYSSPEEALYDFSRDEIDKLTTGLATRAEIAAYSGVETRGVTNFSALKTLNFLKDNMASIGYANVIPSDLASTIGRAVDSASYKKRPQDQFNVAAKRRIDERISSFFANSVVPSGTSALVSGRTGSPMGSTITPAPVNFGDEPMWLTDRAAISSGVGGDAPIQDADTTVRSVYAAGMKEALGLFHWSEGRSDRNRTAAIAPRDPTDRGKDAFENLVSFGMVFMLNIEVKGQKPVQPCIFSMGYSNLFVSRPANTVSHPISMDGCTVRLHRHDCKNHGPHCECGKPGLPESVLPASEAMSNAVTSQFFTVVFSQDIKISHPTCSMIRSKNA